MSLATIEPYSMSTSEARSITDQIKEHTDAVWKLLVVAHEGQAWKPLGYSTWADYVAGEFSMSRAYSYRVLDQARVIRAIEEAVSPNGDISAALTEKAARDIKPVLSTVVDDIREGVADLGPEPEPERVQAVVDEVVQSHRRAPEPYWSPDDSFTGADPLTGEVIEPTEITETHTVKQTFSLPPVPKANKSVKQQNAEQAAADFGHSLFSLVRATSPEGRQVLINAWKVGADACTPTAAEYVTAGWFRTIARGLNALANEWETK